ncbi:histidine kinase [Streptomyces sp. NPDC048106]|uniref:sensor histidine kinase n=1 Tax=Streptomyces sp. NPDC048106 TaxID=3155750 RepID=UPI0034521C14
MDGSNGDRREAIPTPVSGNALPAPRLARTILLTALLGSTLLTTTDILSSGASPSAETAWLLLLPVILALQVLHSVPDSSRAPLPRKCLTLAAQVLLTYLPLLLFRTFWATMAACLAGSLLLLLPPRAAWPLFGLVGLSMVVPTALDGGPVVESIRLSQVSLLTGFVLYGLARLTALITQLHAVRGELVRRAVTAERLRFARDLHDLLGHSLSAITLKSELIHQLIPAHPARAVKEAGEVMSIAEQSLADVRRAASGFRDLSLRQEIKSARSMLDAAGITVWAKVELGPLSPHVDTALATTLREAVTNLLRHSDASHCRIEAVELDGVVRLLVENDGADAAHHDPSPYGGHGLGNLRERMTAVGGRLESGAWPGGTFRLLAEVPAQRPSSTARTGG